MKITLSAFKRTMFLFVQLSITSSLVLAQDTKIQIYSGDNDAAVYSVNGFMGKTPFIESVSFAMVR